MLQIIVANNIRIRGSNVPLRAAITQALTLKNPAWEEKKKKKQPTWGVEENLRLYNYDPDGTLIVPRGFHNELLGILQKQGITPAKVINYQFTEFASRTEFGPWNPEYPPRDYQAPAIKAAAEAGSGVLVSPAGSGKTLMGFAIIEAWGQPALWLTHTTDLLYQAADNAQKYLQGVGRVGLIGDSKLEWGDGKLFVATVQTLGQQPALVSTLNGLVGTVVVDEAHHFPAVQFIETAGKFTAKHFLGLTATPNRKDLLEVYMYRGIGPKVYQVERDGLYDAGALVLPEVIFKYTDFGVDRGYRDEELQNVDAGGEDLDYTQLVKDLISDEGRAKFIAESILDGCIEASPQGGASIVITESVRYCFVLRDLVERFAKTRLGGNVPRMAVVHGGISQYTWRKAHAGKKATKEDVLRQYPDAVDARDHKTHGWQIKVEQYTDEEMQAWQVTGTQRKDIMDRARARQIDILFATQLAREGLDIPHLSVGHLAMPKRGDGRTSANGSSVEQEIGRIMRPDPKNPNKVAKWYDYVDANVGVFNDQYYSRRKVYQRMGITLPKKPRTSKQKDIDFLLSGRAFSGLPL